MSQKTTSINPEKNAIRQLVNVHDHAIAIDANESRVIERTVPDVVNNFVKASRISRSFVLQYLEFLW